MTHADSSSIAHILASPWQQWRNTRTPLKLWTQLTLIVLAPLVVYAWNEWRIARHPISAPSRAMHFMIEAERHRQSVSGSMSMVGTWLLMGWIVVVTNVLQQNQPTFARLVPGHVARLRSALLAAWALVILAAAAGPGFALDAPLEWACLAGAAMALSTLAIRWPMMWVPIVALPVSLPLWLFGNDHAGLRDALWSVWQRNDWLVAAIVVTAGALAPAAIVREAGRGPRTSYGTGRALGRRFATSPRPGCAASQSHRMSSAYAWWMGRLLARRDSPVASRLLLGFGPASHWTTRIREGAWFVAVGGGICVLVVGPAAFLGRDLRGVLPWLSFSLLTAACTPALQAAAQLYRTQREQALLVLLPGVPRGARLSRWLAWRMSALFVGSALFGFALVAALDALAEALAPGLVERSGAGDLTAAVAVAVLPQVGWQWRRWARLHGSSGVEFLPSLAPFALGGAALALHVWARFGYLAMGVVFAAVALAYCAWRWWRMGGEPTAMPIGRLA